MSETEQSQSIEQVQSIESWHAMSPEEVKDKLGVTREKGLSEAEVEQRLEEFGFNELEEGERTTIWEMLWAQVSDFVVVLLLVAAVISALLGDWVESAAIMTIVILNAVLGVIQERRAEEALAALKKMSAPDADVLRDGHRKSISSRKVVPGDIVFLEAGNYVPADVRLLESINLKINEAALTGESVPVNKNAHLHLEKDIPLGDRKTMAYTGTMVTYGRGVGVIVNTGMSSEIGQIAEMLQEVEGEETPLQKRLDRFGQTLGWAALAICGIIFLVGMFRGTAPLEMFIIAVSLAIAAVPEGLPAVVTITLALGMQEMIERNALIRRLSSVETLGSATIICSDKTGTLTQNEMTVTRVAVDGEFIEVTGSGYQPEGEFLQGGEEVNLSEDYPGILTALWIGALNNDATLETEYDKEGKGKVRMVGDPTEGALLVAAAKAGALPDPIAQAYPRIEEIPFDSERKRMVTIHNIKEPETGDVSPFYDKKHRAWFVVTSKGAPDVILDRCTHYQSIDDEAKPLDEEQRRRILKANDDMTKDALRVLGVAYKVVNDLDKDENGLPDDIENGLIFVGLLGMIDPPRPEVVPALNKARNAGIRTAMITGDYPNTAQAIAQEINLLQEGHEVMTGKELDALSDEELKERVIRTDVYARVNPQHKVRIVDAFKANNEVVAMTGDGVNDAPSIKRADIGVAMGITGTDVAKETADMVLTDDNYASIVAAVEQGRVIYSNIRKFVYFLISCNLAEIATIFLAIMFGWSSPLKAIQLLWLNLITDGAPALALGMEEGEPDLMERPPRNPEEPILNPYMRQGIAIQTVAITAVTLGAFWIGLRYYPEMAQTMAFVTLSFSELLRAYTARSERYPVLKMGVFKSKYMNLAVLSSLLLLLVAIYVPFLQKVFDTVPLTWLQWRWILPLLFIPAIVAELFKYLTTPERDKKQGE